MNAVSIPDYVRCGSMPYYVTWTRLVMVCLAVLLGVVALSEVQEHLPVECELRWGCGGEARRDGSCTVGSPSLTTPPPSPQRTSCAMRAWASALHHAIPPLPLRPAAQICAPPRAAPLTAP